MTTTADVVEWLNAAPRPHDIKYQLDKLEAIRQWCLASFPVKVGGPVRLTRSPDTSREQAWGWHPYRECLVEGATARVKDIDYNQTRNRWDASVTLDRCWTVAEWARGTQRYWEGSADTTPPGYEPPSKYDTEHYPEGRRPLFYLPLTYLEPVER